MRGWATLDTDGSSLSDSSIATRGAVLRDKVGVWLCGFMQNIGVCLSREAELWGVFKGLTMAWDQK